MRDKIIETSKQRTERIRKKVQIRKERLAHSVLAECIKVKQEQPEQNNIIQAKSMSQSINKNQIQRIKNRLSAQRCRQQRKHRLNKLQDQVRILRSIVSNCPKCHSCLQEYFRYNIYTQHHIQNYQRGDQAQQRHKDKIKDQIKDYQKPYLLSLYSQQNPFGQYPTPSYYGYPPQPSWPQSQLQHQALLNSNVELHKNHQNLDQAKVLDNNHPEVKCETETDKVKKEQFEFSRQREPSQHKIISFINIFLLILIFLFCLCPGSQISQQQSRLHIRSEQSRLLIAKSFNETVYNEGAFSNNYFRNPNWNYTKEALIVQDLKRQKYLLCRDHMNTERCEIYKSKSVIFIRDQKIVKTQNTNDFIITQWINLIFYVEGIGYFNVKGKVNGVRLLINDFIYTDHESQPKIKYKS